MIERRFFDLPPGAPRVQLREAGRLLRWAGLLAVLVASALILWAAPLRVGPPAHLGVRGGAVALEVGVQATAITPITATTDPASGFVYSGESYNVACNITGGSVTLYPAVHDGTRWQVFQGLPCTITSATAAEGTCAMAAPLSGSGLTWNVLTNGAGTLSSCTASARSGPAPVARSGSSGGGGGTVTSIACGLGLTCAPGSPITGAGTISLDAGVPTGLADPTASLGLTAVNGVATTAMRSDAAPALDQGISPTWSGTHTFSLAATFTTSVLTDLIDARTATTLAIGTTTATGIGLQQTTTLAANKNLVAAAGTSAFNFGSATGDWSMPTGAGSYLGASGKALSLRTTAANVTIATVTSGTISIDTASSTQAINIGASTGGNVTLGRAATAVLFAGQANLNAGVDLTTSVGASDLDFSLSTGNAFLPSGNISYTGASNKTINLATTGGSGSITFQTTTADILLTIITNGASLNLVGSTGRFSLSGTGGGGIAYNGTDRWALRVGSQAFTLGVTSGATTAGYSFTGAAHTTLTASTERVIFDVNMAQSVQFAAGALTTQRGALFRAPTYRFVSASTLTNAATLAIDAAPTASTNATITNAYALWVQSGTSRFDGAVSLGSTISGDGSGLTSIVSGVVTAGANTGLGGGTTSYLLAPGSGVAAATSQVPLIVAPAALTYGPLRCRVTAACGVGEQIVFTMQTSTDNGGAYGDTANICTISGASAVNCTGTAAAGALGDLVAIKSVSSAGCTVFNAACSFLTYQ